MIDPLWIDELARLAKLGLDDDGMFVERDAPMSITVRSSLARHPRMTVCSKRVAFDALIALDADTTGPILRIPALVGDERAVVVCQLARLWGVERVFYLGDPDPVDAVCFAALSSLLRREAGVREATWLSHSGLSELEIERNRRMCEIGLCAIEREIVARWTDPALIELSDGPLATELARWKTRAMKVELEGLKHLADPRPSLRAQLT
ncbi:MAG: hypothetical protein JNK05_07465 [Myxococcales bacterium]|nr:hypothetical protein [Myxococcales bacterium]